MAYVRRRRIARRRAVRRRPYVRRARRLARPARPMYNRMPTFSETLDAGTLNASNSGVAGVFNCGITSVPQWQNYSNLQTQQCIRKLEVIIVPTWTSCDLTTAIDPTTGTGGLNTETQPRLTYAIQDSPEEGPPANELEVLSMNGARIRVVNGRPFRLQCKPKPSVGVTNMAVGGNVGQLQRAPMWFNFPESDAPSDPANVIHSGINFWSQLGQTALSLVAVAKVQYKITFSLRDPK